MLSKSEGTVRSKPAKMIENSLYHYVQTHKRILAQKISKKIDCSAESSSSRDAIYIRLPLPEHALLCSHDTWQLHEQHLTIDKHMHHELTVFSSSHFTQKYTNTTHEHQQAIVHVYFDRQGNMKSTIHIHVKDINVGSDLGCTHTFIENKAAIMAQAELCQMVLLAIIREKARYFISLSKEHIEVDWQLSTLNERIITACPNKKLAIIQQAIATSEKHIETLERLILNSDSDMEHAIYEGKKSCVTRVCEELKRQYALPVSVIGASGATMTEEEFTGAVVVASQPSRPPLNAYKVAKKELTDAIDRYLITTADDDIVVIFKRLESIFDHFLQFELSFNNKDIPSFLATQRARLPAKNRHDFFLTMCIHGPLEHVTTIYPHMLLNLDMMHVFSDLHETIIQNDVPMENIIRVVDFMYEHSTEYQAYLIMERYKFFQNNNSFGHMVSPLIMAFTTDNYLAFQMYLRQGKSPNAIHMIEDNIGLNALQTLVLLSRKLYEKMSPITINRYIGMLFEYGAQLTTSVFREEHLGYAVEFAQLMKEQKTMSNAVTHLHAVYLGSGAKMSGKTAQRDTCPSGNVETLKKVQQIPTILQLVATICFDQRFYPSIIESIASYADYKMCLNATLRFLIEARFTRVSVTAMEGGLRCFKDMPEFEQWWSRRELPCRMLTTFQLMYIFDDSIIINEHVNKDDILLKFHLLLTRVHTLYGLLTAEEKEQVVKELKKDAIKSELEKKDLTTRLIAFEAVLFTLTLISTPTKADLLSLVNSSINVFELTMEQKNKDDPMYLNLCNIHLDKLKSIISGFPREMQAEISTSHLFVKFAAKANKYVASPIESCSMFRSPDKTLGLSGTKTTFDSTRNAASKR